MSTGTKIEWTEATWNPVTGCTKVSPGCDHCYAERITNRFSGPGAFDTVTLHPERLDAPLRWRKPRRVFVNSMSDLFHDDVPEGFIGAVFEVMARASDHTFQVLTKRHGRMRSLLTRWASEGKRRTLYDRLHRPMGDVTHTTPLWTPPRNVWLGVSVEDQRWADIRIPALLDTPAAVRFLSCEPLLGSVDLTTVNRNGMCNALDDVGRNPVVDWVIAGGESGPGARPMHPQWARSLRDQCSNAGVPFFFKQHGEWTAEQGHNWGEGNGRRLHYHREFVLPDGTFAGPWQQGGTLMERVGKRAAGRDLDGRTWDEYPEVTV